MKMGDLKQKLLTSKVYLNDAQFVKDFLISSVENRKKEEENLHSADISHIFDDEISRERKALTLDSEANLRETESFPPQQPSEGTGKEEKSEKPMEVRRSDVSPSARTKQERSEVLKNADDFTRSIGGYERSKDHVHHKRKLSYSAKLRREIICLSMMVFFIIQTRYWNSLLPNSFFYRINDNKF
ncbi:hypothetical protein AVEN_109148-1 [Araneus ventricosus]|uniref:Uncharacterized protein n=1 Tax=Araneus ventricosus TaxID=182803 RepID=A0A4Y2RFI2_ARAVE|nr:hypothetical protein AVEN_109148-1 [Araneus ventricosus]